MRAQCSVFIATSLDGFIAREDGAIDWLDRANLSAPKGEDFGYAAFMKSVDGLVIGRKTFETVLAFGGWAYGNARVEVLSRTLEALPPGLPPTVSLTREDPVAIVDRLSRDGAKRLYVDGGRTVQSFLEQDLLDDLTITRIPVLLGSGIPLFGATGRDIVLEHVGTTTYSCGFVQSRYRVQRRR